MLKIYADTYNIAARTECRTVVDAPRHGQKGLTLKRFLPRRRKCIDLGNL